MQDPSQVVSGDPAGKETPPPPVTSDIKDRSDQRMSGFLRSIERNPQKVGANFSAPTPTVGAKPDGAVTPPAPTSQATPPPTPVAPKKDEPKPPEPPKPPVKVTPPAINYEEEYKKHQSRADKLQLELDSYKGKKAIPEEEFTALSEAKTKVDAFVADPVGFMLKYTPDIAKKLSAAGDPLKMVELEVQDFKSELDKQFETQLGKDWRFDATEALTPGTPSFRYKLAIEERTAEVRNRYHQSVHEAAENQRLAAEEKAKDIAKIKSEFNFTDEDIKRAEENLAKMKVSHYTFLKLGLMDDILQRKLSAIVQPPTPPPDLSHRPAAEDGEEPKKKVEVSERGREMLSRLGPRTVMSKGQTPRYKEH